jgi:HAD superfamily hydrolase (TIGR01549 family)
MVLELNRISAICFDIDGTLKDTDDSLARQIASFLRPAGFLFIDKDLARISRRLVMAMENPGNFLHALSDRLHLDGILDQLENQIYRRGFFTNVEDYQMIPSVYDMLELLRTQYSLAVVTARGEWKTMAFLDKFELTPFFSAIATSQTCKYTKPYPDPIIWVANQMGVASESCLMVGDTTADMRPGKAANAQTVGVLCGFGEQDELLQAGADLILAQTRDLKEVLLSDPLAK